jgi:hypothetical protein
MKNWIRAAVVAATTTTLVGFVLVGTSSAKPPAPAPKVYSNVILKEISVDRAGAITGLLIREGNANYQVRGCGARLADHPELLESIRAKHTLGEVMVDAGGCLTSINIFN